MIKTIINEIKIKLKESPSDLLSRLIAARLDVATKAYYSDISDKFDYYYYRAQDNELKVAKDLLKRR